MSLLKRKLARCFTVCFLIGGIVLLSSQKIATREYQVKAVFVFNFTQFIEWPANAFTSAQAPMVIGILGADPFGTYLDQTVSGEIANGHPLVVKRYRTIEEVHGCHILYISLSEVAKMESIIAKTKGRNILTVSDSPSFMKQGGMIRFYTLEDKIQLQVNPEGAKAEGLTISSKLLRLATVYVPKK